MVNASPSISGRYPNLGPEILVASDILLVDGVGDKIFARLKDGAKIRIDGGAVYAGDEAIAQGTEQTRESIADLMIEAKTGHVGPAGGVRRQRDRVHEAGAHAAARRRRHPRDQHRPRRTGRCCWSPASADTKAQLKSLKKYISDFRPVLVGVDGGADALRAAGYKPALIIGNPESHRLGDAALRRRGGHPRAHRRARARPGAAAGPRRSAR